MLFSQIGQRLSSSYKSYLFISANPRFAMSLLQGPQICLVSNFSVGRFTPNLCSLQKKKVSLSYLNSTPKPHESHSTNNIFLLIVFSIFLLVVNGYFRPLPPLKQKAVRTFHLSLYLLRSEISQPLWRLVRLFPANSRFPYLLFPFGKK